MAGLAMSHLMKGKVYGLSMNKKATTMPHLHNVTNPLMSKSKMNKPSIFGAEESSDEDDGELRRTIQSPSSTNSKFG